MSDLLERAFALQAKSLVEFGYSGTDAAKVRSAFERWKRGDRDGADVVDQFCFSAFESYPDIFGSPDPAAPAKGLKL